MTERPRLGKLPPLYNFVLNAYSETRVSRCPGCDKKMRQRKLPLFIHVDPMHPVAINYTCRYCPDCDLLVAHQDEIEQLLAGLFAQHKPEVIGNDYLVMGTIERVAWRESQRRPMAPLEILEQLHDFKEVMSFEYRPAGWYRDDEVEAQERKREKPREQAKPETKPGPPRKRRQKRSKKRR